MDENSNPTTEKKMKLELAFNTAPTSDEDTTKNQLATRTFHRIESKGYEVEFRRTEWRTVTGTETVQKSKSSAVTTTITKTYRTRRWFFDVFTPEDGELLGEVSFNEMEDGSCGSWGFSSHNLREALGAKESV